MSSPAGVRLPVCIFCRFISHNPTTPTARRRLGPKTATRYESTRVHIPKQYGHNVGRTPEKIVEDLYFKKIIRSQLEPAVVVPDYPSSSRTTRDLRMGRFYELGPAGMIKDVLEHDIPEDYYWPNPRLPPAVVWEGRWQDIDWGGIEGIPRGYKSKRGELLKILEAIRESIAQGMAEQEIYIEHIDKINESVPKAEALLEVFRIFMKQKAWDKFAATLEIFNMDSYITTVWRRGILNRLFRELAANGRTNKSSKEVFDLMSLYFKRPFTSEAILFLYDHIWVTTTVLRLFFEDHGIHPHISVSNKALAKEMENINNSRKWPKPEGNKPRTDPTYYMARRKIYRKLTTHFDADRVNAQSIRLLLTHACDRDEVKRIMQITLQAAKRDPAVLRKNQHLFLEGLSKYPIEVWDIQDKGDNMTYTPEVYQKAENLAELCDFYHILKSRKQQPNRSFLISLITASAMHGSSMALNELIPELVRRHWKPEFRELRIILRALPRELGADLLTHRHRIIGNPIAWARKQQKSVLVQHLRQFVQDNEACLVEYVRALGRCGAGFEIWEEWSRLRRRGFCMVDGGKRVKDGTLAGFTAGLGEAGETVLARKCLAELGEFGGAQITPTFMAGLMASQPPRPGTRLQWILASPLTEIFKERVSPAKVLARMRSGRMDTAWTVDEKERASITLQEVSNYKRRVQKGLDLVWAEDAVVKLLTAAESRDGANRPMISLTVELPKKQSPEFVQL